MRVKSTVNRVTPALSVILPVRNAENYLAEAISSIQSQSFANWELIVVDDASTDQSAKIAKKLAKNDPRIRFFQNRTRKGVASSSNLALQKARGRFVARMDADDISLPNRFAQQLQFLLKNKDVVAVGGQCTIIDASGKTIGEKRFPTTPSDVYKMAFSFLPVQQPTLMINRTNLPTMFVWYPNKYESGEEHELLFKLFEFGKVANLHTTVLKYRLHGRNISTQNPKRDFYKICTTRIKAITKYHYRPTIAGVLKVIGQFLIVSIVPNSVIFQLYSKIRGLKKNT